MKEILKLNNGVVDEMWLADVLQENALLAKQKKQLTPEFGACCLRFVDAIICNPAYGYVRLDKLAKAEVCSKVYLHLCQKVACYDVSRGNKASAWMYTVAKNAISNFVRDVIMADCVTDIVAAVIGSETLTKLDGIESHLNDGKFLSERVAALSDFRLDEKAKSKLFSSVSGSFFSSGSIVERARKHKAREACKIDKQADLDEDQRNELVKLIEGRNG